MPQERKYAKLRHIMRCYPDSNVPINTDPTPYQSHSDDAWRREEILEWLALDQPGVNELPPPVPPLPEV